MDFGEWCQMFKLRKIAKYICCLAFLSFDVNAVQGDFTIVSVGSSNNTNTIFIETSESAVSSTECYRKNVFRISDTDKSADRLFSLALAAQAQDKKITIDYSESECLESGILIKVFRLKSV